MTKQKMTISNAIWNIFESNETKNLIEIYEAVLEYGVEDKGSITKHTIRGIVHKLHKTEKIRRVSKGSYVKIQDDVQEQGS